MEQTAPQPPRLLDRVRMTLRARHGSRRTEKAYVAWIRRFILFHGKRHPSTMGGAEVTQFLSALLFLYRDVLGQELPWLDDVVRAKRPTLIPVVLSRREVHGIIGSLDGPVRLLVLLLYGSGLRLLEALCLRVKDVDFARNQITVHGGKGDRDRATMLPAALALDLAKHLETVRDLHETDLRAGAG
jgi:integrase